MEPAAQQRDDAPYFAKARGEKGGPQWSPPLSSGMTTPTAAPTGP